MILLVQEGSKVFKEYFDPNGNIYYKDFSVIVKDDIRTFYIRILNMKNLVDNISREKGERITLETRYRRENGITEPVLSDKGHPILTSVWCPTIKQINEVRKIPFYNAIKFTGRTFPHVVRKLLLLYSDQDSQVYDPMLGTGTTLFECHKLGRRVMGSDVNINTVKNFKNRWKKYTEWKMPKVRQSDAADLKHVKSGSVDLLIMSFPWYTSWKFGETPDSMESHKTKKLFLQKSLDIYTECCRVVKVGGFVCNIMGNTFRQGKYYPITLELMGIIKQSGLALWYQFWNLRCTTGQLTEPWSRSGLDINNKKADARVGWDVHEDIIVARKPKQKKRK